MKHEEVASAIAAQLDKSASFRQDWFRSPQVMHIPFMGTRENFFLLVNVFVRPELNDRERLISGCFTTVQFIIGLGLLTDEKGIEIAAWTQIPERENLRRLFRLSVLDIAYDEAMRLDPADVIERQHVGITCQWPLRSP